ncbi:uncharacterized protein LOC141901798 isoform X2 [Tubulanus polymorphus]|uniref:uncharacterized protein LOC141901798 isoform X2 n=1 Tax=Tubulanus polymorphus TaxID=672921 RepID=UPI003DA37673
MKLGCWACVIIVLVHCFVCTAIEVIIQPDGTTKNITLEPGMALIVKFNVTGNYTCEWSKIQAGVIEFSEHNLMKMNNVTPDNAGTYLCKCPIPGKGLLMGSVRLIIKVEPNEAVLTQANGTMYVCKTLPPSYPKCQVQWWAKTFSGIFTRLQPTFYKDTRSSGSMRSQHRSELNEEGLSDNYTVLECRVVYDDIYLANLTQSIHLTTVATTQFTNATTTTSLPEAASTLPHLSSSTVPSTQSKTSVVLSASIPTNPILTSNVTSSTPVTSDTSTVSHSEIKPTNPSMTATNDPSSVSSTATIVPTTQSTNFKDRTTQIPTNSTTSMPITSDGEVSYSEIQTTSSSKSPTTVTNLSSVSSTNAAASIGSTAVEPRSTVPPPPQTLDKMSLIAGIVAGSVVIFIIISVTIFIRRRGLLTCREKKNVHNSKRYDPDDIQLDPYLNRRNGSIGDDRKKSGKSVRFSETPTETNRSHIQNAWAEAIKEANEDQRAISGDPDLIETYVGTSTLSTELAPMKKKVGNKNELPNLVRESTLNDTDFDNFDHYHLDLETSDEQAESPYYEVNDDDLMEISMRTDNRDSAVRKSDSGLINEAFDSKDESDYFSLSNGNRVVIENDLYVTSGRLNDRNYNTHTGNLIDTSDEV